MELHKAIKSIIDTDGVEIIKDTRLVNILGDLRAFDSIPASKYILRAIIADGYAQKLLAIGTWNDDCEKICNQFITTTGFQNDYAQLVFQSLAYGLGWLNQITLTNNNPKQKQQPITGNPPATNTPKLSKKEHKESYLLSKVEFVSDLKREIGVEMTNLSFEMDTYEKRSFNLNFELKGRNKNDTGHIYAVFYDTKNKIRLKETLWWAYQWESFRGFIIESVYISIPMPVEDVGRICIFVQ